MDIGTLVEGMIRDGSFSRVINNPIAQFGPRTDPFLGAGLLPERPVPENYYREEAIQYRTIVANDATRYGPVQIKAGVLTGWFDVALSESDTGNHFTGSDYDTLLRILARSGQGNVPMSAVNSLLQWSDRTLLRPLLVKNEKMRWEAIVDSKVIRTGDNGFYEEIDYSDPSGHRTAAGDSWSDDAYDPYPDITGMMEFLADKGFIVNRIIAGTTVVSKLLNNQKMKDRVGRIKVAAGTVIGSVGRLNFDQLNAILSDDGLPPIEKYDSKYRTQQGTSFYLKRDVMVFACTTGRDETLDLGDVNPLVVQNTLGYLGVGRPAGQTSPGRVVKVRHIDNSKPPRIEGEAWQTSLPVVLDPEAIGVITDID
jgi:hypothetical protein